MLSYLAQIDASIFWLFNHYLRAPFLDVLLPIFSQSLLLWVALLAFITGYVVYCQRQYGEALWRTVVLVMFIGLSVGLADMTCNLFKDLSGRIRPHQSLLGTHYFVDGMWYRISPPMPEQAVIPQASAQESPVPPLPAEQNAQSMIGSGVPPLQTEALPEALPGTQPEGMLFAADTLTPVQQPLLHSVQTGDPENQKALETTTETAEAASAEGTQNANAEETPFTAPDPAHMPVSEPLMPLPSEPVTRGSSFPSSHAANSMAIATVLALLFRRLSPWIFLFPLMVGWSRVYMGKHFPFDVVSGYLVGVLAVLVIWWVFSLIFFRSIRKPRKLSRLNQQN